MKTQQRYQYAPDSTTMKVDCEGSTAIAEFTFSPDLDAKHVWVQVEYRSGGTYSYCVPFGIFYSNLHIASVGKFVATVVKAHATYASERWGAELVAH
jgi:hypothetical protein